MKRFMAIAIVLGTTGPAAAEISVCNDTTQTQTVAVGYASRQGVWTSEGWWDVAPDACLRVQGASLGNRYIYYHATFPGTEFSGDYSFCTALQAFRIEGKTGCAARGFARTRFREIDTEGSEPFVLTLTD